MRKQAAVKAEKYSKTAMEMTQDGPIRWEENGDMTPALPDLFQPDRDSKGRFVKGWRGGPGRESKSTEQAYLEVMIGAVSLSDWKEIVSRAVQDAIKGNSTARQWLSDYLLGKPGVALAVTAKIDQYAQIEANSQQQIDVTVHSDPPDKIAALAEILSILFNAGALPIPAFFGASNEQE
jgi:hypothetical protein